MVTESYELSFQKHGYPEKLAPIVAEEIDAIAGAVPDHICDLMREYGRCRLRNGLFQVIHPNDLASVMDQLLGRDPDLGGEACKAYVMTAFGEVYFWNKKFGIGEVDFVNGTVLCKRLTEDRDGPENDMVAYLPFKLSDEALDLLDTDGKYLFKRARKKLGVPEAMQCYSFVPLPALGGEITLDNLKLNNAGAYLSIAAQSLEFQLCEIGGGGVMSVVRPIA